MTRAAAFCTVIGLSHVQAFSPLTDHLRTDSRAAKRGNYLVPLHISLEDEWSDLADIVSKSTNDVDVKYQLGQIAKQASEIEWNKILTPGPGVTQVEKVVDTLITAYLGLPFWAETAVILLPIIGLSTAALYALSFPADDFREGFEPYPRGQYDPLQARVYYSKHGLLVFQRVLQLLRLGNRYLINVFIDKYIFRDEESVRSKRAEELLDLVNRAGPTAIKVGQALSVRGDLIPQEFADALSTLQDRVPPFPGEKAKDLLLKELGPDRFGKLKDMTFEKGPVASASIGQVYRGFIDEKEVAVKCQRPNALSEIALDLHLVREFAPVYQKIVGASTDFQSLANEWGRGFIDELDYRTEAENTIQFNKDMQARKLTAVTAPTVVTDYSTERILVTEWVNGVRLDRSTSNDVPRLCSVALNAYLVMLLETRRLHCDPHPGNILRMDDGRLCILDFGMTLETDPELQYSLLNFVAHLTGEDYERIPEDLVKLGFLKAERFDTVRASGFLEPLTYMLKQAGEGGGADKVRERIFAEFREKYPGMPDEELRVQMRADMKKRIEETRKKESAVSGITMEVEELQKRNRDAFSIPDWFVYTSRAFLTLEGVSLQADENFSIIKSCFPYVAKRLLGDDSPQAQKALRDLLYGAGSYLEADRLTDLADGFATYTTTTKVLDEEQLGLDGAKLPNISGEKEKRRASLAKAEAAVTLAKESADILLAPEGNLVQNLLVEETALAASAQVKDALRDAFIDAPQRLRDSLPLGIGAAIPRPPFEDELTRFLKKNKNEEMAQTLIGKVSYYLPQGPNFTSFLDPNRPTNVDGMLPLERATLGSFDEIEPEQAAYVAKELRENVPKYAPLVGKLGNKFASRLLQTASISIESTLADMQQRKQRDSIVTVAAKSLSHLALRGAESIIGDDDAVRKSEK